MDFCRGSAVPDGPERRWLRFQGPTINTMFLKKGNWVSQTLMECFSSPVTGEVQLFLYELIHKSAQHECLNFNMI